MKLQNAAALREAFGQSQYGQLWNDPAVKASKEEILSRVDAREQDPQGKGRRHLPRVDRATSRADRIAFSAGAQRSQDPARAPGHRRRRHERAKMADVLTKATKQGEQNGGKISKEKFKGLTLSRHRPPSQARRSAKEDQPDRADRLVAQESVFTSAPTSTP